MFDFIHNNKRLIQFVLALVFLPFAFFGVDSYFRSSDRGSAIASVGGVPVTQQEFSLALQERQNYLQRLVGGRVDPALLDSPELRYAVLDSLVRQRLLVGQAIRENVLVSDQQLQQVIAEQPAFRDNGAFSRERYVQILKNQNTTPVGFENGLRRDLMLQRVSDAYSATAIVSNATAERLLRIRAQQREVSQSVIDAKAFVSQVRLEGGAAKQYYDAHPSEFQVPEQARLEYLVLALDDIAARVDVGADEVKQFYEQNLRQYAKSEQRQASHILIAADDQASPQDKEAARAKAEQLLKEVKQNPASFADVAKKYSQDPGSAAKGGDLGLLPRGALQIAALEDAIFSMKPGEIAGPIESKYGYHIVRLTAARGQGFDEVRRQVELDLRRQKAGKRFAELAEQFNNIVFEQGDSLKPAADALKLSIRSSGWVSRGGADDKLLNNPKLLQAVFADDSIKGKRNTEVVDVGGDNLVSARVIDYKPAATRPFAEVSATIAERLTQQQAGQLAAKHGRDLLARLKRGEGDALTWGAPKLVSRDKAQDYTGPALIELFKVDTGKLPAYAGFESAQGGYTLLKITRVVEVDTIDAAKRKAAADELRQLLGQEQLNAFVASLKLKADVKVQQDRLEKNPQQ